MPSAGSSTKTARLFRASALDDRPRRRAADLLVRRQQQDNAMPALTSGLGQHVRIASMAIAMPAFMS